MAISTAQDFGGSNAFSGVRLPRLLDSAFTETLADNKTLDADIPMIYKPDPGGSGRDITLDAEATSTGMHRFIINGADGDEDLTVKNDGANTIGTVSQNEMGWFYCDGTDWVVLFIITGALS